jgi:acetyl-CoA C-acetyltransferase
MDDNVAVIGVGLGKVGEHWEKSLRDLAIESIWMAFEDSGIDKVDALYVGNMSSGPFVEQEHIGALIADFAGLGPIPAVKVEAACGSGGAAFIEGYMGVKSGMYDYVLVTGVEKMTDVLPSKTTSILANASDRDYEAFHGVSFVALNALVMRRYMHEFKVKREDLSIFPVISHKNAPFSKHAMYRKEISLEAVMNSPIIADPLSLMDCAPICDGAASVILCSEKKAREFTDTPIIVSGVGLATDTLGVHDRKHMTTLSAAVEASKKAYKMAGVTPKDIDIAEIHDAFSIMSALSIEDMGFAKKGQGTKMALEGQHYIGGDLPINLYGGLKARGHPVGATGVYQIGELVYSLRGDGRVDAERGLAENIGGSGATVSVCVLERGD